MVTNANDWGSAAPTVVASLAIRAMRARLLSGRLRKLACRLLAERGPDYDIEVGGVRLRCRLGDNTTEASVLARGLRTRGLRVLRQTLEPGDSFVDVGANCGLFSVLGAHAVGPAGRVLAIEPLPAMLDRLTFNVAANGLGNVAIVAAAVGPKHGTAPLHVMRGDYGNSHLGALNGHAAETIDVPMKPLAAIVSDAGLARIDFLKIDVEGYEDQALLPYIATMPKNLWPRRILIEVVHAKSWQTDCLAALREAGYVETWTDRRDSLLHLPA